LQQKHSKETVQNTLRPQPQIAGLRGFDVMLRQTAGIIG
jgi:hypothetical protein